MLPVFRSALKFTKDALNPELIEDESWNVQNQPSFGLGGSVESLLCCHRQDEAYEDRRRVCRVESSSCPH